MLIGSTLNIFEYGMYGLFLFLDSIVYWLVYVLFSLFNLLAGAQILTENSYIQIVQNIYVILGVAMLFYISYSLLRSLINPDDFGKNTSKIVINTLTSLVLLGVIPVIFTYAFQLQNIIIEENIIDGIIFGEGNNLKDTSNSIAFSTLNTFINPTNKNIEGTTKNWEWFAYGIKTNASDISFFDLTEFIEPLGKGEATYIPIVSTIVGLFLAYMLFTFGLDLAIRVTKLAFYQIIAPIPIIMRIIPEKKSTFDNWIKGTLATYLEVFIRMFIMFIVVFLAGKVASGEIGFGVVQTKSNIPIINTFQIQDKNNVKLLSGVGNEKTNINFKKNDNAKIVQLANSTDNENPSVTTKNTGFLGTIANCFIILGLFAFAKQAPKLISDITGIDSNNIKLGIGGKLSAMGAFAAVGLLGGGLTTGLRNTFRTIGAAGWDNVKNAQGFSEKAKAIGNALWKTTGGAVSSGFAGAISGGIRSGYGGWKAKNFKETVEATHKGIANAEKAREKRLSYKASHGNNPLGVAQGRIGDLYHGALDYLGVGPNIEALKRESELLNDISSKRKAAADAAEAEINKKMPFFESTIAKSVEGVDYTSLSVLDNVIETVKTQGSFKDRYGATITDVNEVARHLNDLQQARADLKEEMIKQYLNGVNLDSTDPNWGTVSKSHISGPVQEAISALNTSIKNNIGAIERNLTSADLSNQKIRDMRDAIQEYIKGSSNMNITEVMGNAAFDIGELADNIKKYAGTAGTNVNTKINEFRQQEAQRNGNNNGGH